MNGLRKIIQRMGVFKIYWAKDGGLSVKDEGLGQRFEWSYKDGKRGNGPI